MDTNPLPVNRRAFLSTVTAAAVAGAAGRLAAQDDSRAIAKQAVTDTALITKTPPKLKLGMDNFAVRAMGWKALQLIDYAASLKCDTLLISDLDSYDSLDDAALREIKAKADAVGLELYAGSWSICPTSTRFKKNWGTAEEHVRLGLRVAKTLGSPVFRVVLGAAEDRKTPGGIQARIADTVAVLRTCRKDILDSGVKIAIENHAGDLHSWELAALIEAAGPDYVGANLDSGNAAWTLEDPADVLENLGKYTLCSSLRDDMIWETPDGASVQWTAAGQGLMDWKAFTARWSALCPAVPIIIETISGFARNFPYKKEGFWKDYDQRPAAFARFEALAKRGHAIPSFKAPEGVDRKKAEQDYQKAQLEESFTYLREKIGLGLKV